MSLSIGSGVVSTLYCRLVIQYETAKERKIYRNCVIAETRILKQMLLEQQPHSSFMSLKRNPAEKVKARKREENKKINHFFASDGGGDDLQPIKHHGRPPPNVIKLLKATQ